MGGRPVAGHHGGVSGDGSAGSPSGGLSDELRHLLALAALARPALARRLDLSVTETWAIEHLMGEPMGPVALAQRLDITSAASTVLVRRLETAGHVRREPHWRDRRRTVLRVTPEAEAAVREAIDPMIADLEAAAAPLDAAERELVAGYLRRVAEAVSRLVGEGVPGPEAVD